MTRLAVVQYAPVHLDRAATLAKAVSAVADAVREGAKLLVFPEAFVPGYPAWMWRLRPGADMALTEKLHTRLRNEAVDLSRDDLALLRDAASKHQVTIVCGMHERDGSFSRSTLYNTVVVIGPDGTLLNRHRKVMPTNPERMVWGFGDATGLKVVDTPVGRVGTLICWENYMPLARCALYAQGVDILIAPTFDSGDRCVATMQHIAREGGCWVVSAGCALRAADLTPAARELVELYPHAYEWINSGDSVIVAPGGKVVAGPLHETHGMLFAEIDLERVGMARRSLDVVGHYGRPDLFQLHVNTRPANPVVFSED